MVTTINGECNKTKRFSLDNDIIELEVKFIITKFYSSDYVHILKASTTINS